MKNSIVVHPMRLLFRSTKETTCKTFSIATCVLLLVSVLLGCGDKTSGSGSHMKVSLVADQESISRGSRFTLGVHFEPDPGWHIYWKNAGDSGLPPQFDWTTADGISVQEPLWPSPERLATGPLVNYILHETLLPFPVTASSAVDSSKVTTSVHLEWLVCKDECLPGEATLSLTLPVTNYPGAPSPQWKSFEKSFSNVPIPLEKVSIAIEERLKEIVVAIIPLDDQMLPADVVFIPEDRRIISNSAPQRSEKDGDVLRLFIQRDPYRQESISRLKGVLVSPSGWSSTGTPKAVTIDTNPNAPSSANNTLQQALPDKSVQQTSLVIILLSALVGGSLLNLMPCVFPVLSIKILGFIEHAHKTNSSTKKHGVAFSLGVVCSFWILATIFLALRAGGEQLGWGFQLQSPTFVVVMIFIFTILGLLFLSDLVVGQRIQMLAGRSKLPTNLIGSFLNGVLATAVATPCTAPFMSTALAATLTLSAPSALVVFTALGVGMSIPYLALSLAPSLLKFLPKPGAWMETFKQLMAFPLFASVIWLCRVYARQVGFNEPGVSIFIDILWGILLVGFGFWLAIRATVSRNTLTTRALLILGTLSIASSLYIALPSASKVEDAQTNTCAPTGDAKPFRDSFGLLWETYSEERLARILAQGRPVFLDFTAEWCITCQVNERVVFSSQTVRDLILEKNVTLMRADWTSKNPAITKAIRQFGRNGVPVNVLLTSPQAEPLILPNILTPGIVTKALKTISSNRPIS